MSTESTTEKNQGIVRRGVQAMSRCENDGFIADTANDIVFTPDWSGAVDFLERSKARNI